MLNETGHLTFTPGVLVSICSIFIIYFTGGVIYRLYLSPLAKFPGPKLAAATLWYEFYYDAVRRGRYTFKIKELHQRYGQSILV